MLAAFLNPFTIIAGSALVLTPVIIHLINRIRFRRVEWAAMEFLLKAQKKMRRRKILEQLLLLLLRCVLVFLLGALFARYIGGQSQETRATTHVVVLDDTPSMAEGRGDGTTADAFSDAKRLVYEQLMPAVAEATTGQTLHLVRLSDLDHPFPAGTKTVEGKEVPKGGDELRDEARVHARSITAMEDYLRALQPAPVRQGIVAGLLKAKQLLADRAAGDSARMVHVLSDFRAADWAADGPAIYALVKELKDDGVAVHLVDVASPARKADRKSPPFSDNVAIVELKPRNRVVSVNQQAELDVRVKNFGAADLKDVRIDFYLNGQPDDPFQTINFPSLPANQEQVQTVRGTLKQAGTKDKPLERFNLVTAVLATPERGGLKIDNARHAVIEVRETLKVLVVDGRTVENGRDVRDKPEGDSLYLRKLLLETKAEGLGKIVIEQCDAKGLNGLDLRPFSTVYLMNVPALEEPAVKNVEKFVREGGGVGVFLGPNVKPDEYTARLYKGGAGFFPVPLTKPSPELTPDQRLARALVWSKRVILREAAHKLHPAVRGIYTNDRNELEKDDADKLFFLAGIDTHWEVPRSGVWREDKDVQEIYCLPNESPIASFEGRADDLAAEVKKRYNEAKFEAARKYLDPLLDKIRLTPKTAAPLSELARYLDQLICDQTNDGDESEPVLRDFWSQPEMTDTKRTAQLLRDQAKFGDPLYVVKKFGSGRVAVMTTDAGGTFAGRKQWTDWPSGQGGAGWVIVVGEMQKYLSGGGDDANRSVGDPFTTEFDSTRYEPTAAVSLFTTGDPTKPSADRKLTLDRKDLGRVTLATPKIAEGAQPPPPDAPPPPFQLTYSGAKVPGAYLFTLTRKKQDAPPPAPGAPPAAPDERGGFDYVGVAFNVDALREGDLRRANTDDIAAQTSKAPLHNTEETGWINDLKQKPSDLSSGRWIFLLLLLVLIAEQAWAVRMSFHGRPDDLEAMAPSAAAAYAPRTTATPSADAPTA